MSEFGDWAKSSLASVVEQSGKLFRAATGAKKDEGFGSAGYEDRLSAAVAAHNNSPQGRAERAEWEKANGIESRGAEPDVAVLLTENQVKALLAAETDKTDREVNAAMLDVMRGASVHNVVDNRVQLDYSNDAQSYIGILAPSDKPRLDEALTKAPRTEPTAVSERSPTREASVEHER